VLAFQETTNKHPDAKFNAQSFLLDKFYLWQPFQKNRPKPYKNFTQLIGDPTGLVNKLFSPQSLKTLLNLSSAQLSLLVPKIKLYKVFYRGTKKARNRKEIPLLFNDFTEIKSITESLLGRGTDVGLQSFSWQDLGTNPAETGLAYKAELNIAFQTMEALFKVRENGWRWSDLTLPPQSATVSRSKGQEVVREDADFQIKIVLGWNIPEDPGEVLYSSEDIEAIERTHIPFLLTLYDHQIDLKEDSTVTMGLSYIAAIEGFMLSKDANLFFVEDGKDEAALRATILKIATLEQELTKYQPGAEFDPRAAGWMPQGFYEAHGIGVAETNVGRAEMRDDFKKQLAAAQKEKSSLSFLSRAKAYSRLLEKIDDESRIFAVKITPEVEDMWLDSLNRYSDVRDPKVRAKLVAQGRTLSVQAVEKAIGQHTVHQGHGGVSVNMQNLIDQLKPKTDKERKQIESKVLEKTYEVKVADGSIVVGGDKLIYFFFFGDLVEAAISILKEHNQRIDREMFKFLLGPVEIPKYEGFGPGAKERIYSVPLADVPISLHLFEKWMIKNVIQPRVDNYDLKSFLIDISSTLIKGALTPISFGPVGRNVVNRISFDTFAWAGAPNQRQPFPPPRTNLSRTRPIEWSSAYRDPKNMVQYFLLYLGGSFSNKLKGDPVSDFRDRGIIHFNVGPERGLLKSISFAKTDIPGAREARIEQAKTTGTSNLLFSNRYTAALSMFGNPIFKNGQYIYINPTSLGIPSNYTTTGGRVLSSLEEKLGLGGYYQVIKTSHIIEDGKFETNLALEHIGAKGGGYDVKIAAAGEPILRLTAAPWVQHGSSVPPGESISTVVKPPKVAGAPSPGVPRLRPWVEDALGSAGGVLGRLFGVDPSPWYLNEDD